jgi:exportin-2 (importin alpha re-exporter)
MQFAATMLASYAKNFWENDSLFSNKTAVRTMLIQMLIGSQNFVQQVIMETIAAVASSDYPEKWQSLMPELVEAVSTTDVNVLYGIVGTVAMIFKRYERSAYEQVAKEFRTSCEFWGPTILSLLTQVLPGIPVDGQNATIVENCFIECVKIFHYLSLPELPDFIEVHLPEFFLCFLQMLQVAGFDRLKIQICILLKIYIIRYSCEITRWGVTDDHKENEALLNRQMRELWGSLLTQLLNLFSQYPAGSAPVGLFPAAFDALSALSRSRDRVFFTEGDNLRKVCSVVLIPSIALTEEDVSDFEKDPLNYFIRDIDRVDHEGSNRSTAYMFLKALARYFKNQLMEVFDSWCQELMRSFASNPEENWRGMDTAIFIMSALAAQIQCLDGIKKVTDGFDIASFVTTWILPHLGVSSNFPILQADALKFLVDFRAVLEKEHLASFIPPVVELLMGSQYPCVVFYAAHALERFCIMPDFPELPPVLARVNPAAIVTRLLSIFRYEEEFNGIAARCLMRLVAGGGEAIAGLVPGIISVVVDYLKKTSTGKKDPDFSHSLFETIAAAITRVHIDVSSIEERVIDLLSGILGDDVSEYIPYTFQIVGCMLLGYRPEQPVSNFYTEQFQFFLNPELWGAQGNIPGLAGLVRSYCIRLPELVIASFAQIADISSRLLQGTRSHTHALMMFTSMMRFINIDYLLPCLPQIFDLVSRPLFAEQPVTKYAQSFAVFMANACFVLQPDNALNQLGSNLTTVVNAWAEALPAVHGRFDLTCALVGVLQALTVASVLPDSLWNMLFKGCVSMIESPSRQAWNEELAAYREDEQAKMQFDTTFNVLRYAELPELSLHGDLKAIDLVKFMAETFATWSHSHPGRLGNAVLELPAQIQSCFVRYRDHYNVQFS